VVDDLSGQQHLRYIKAQHRGRALWITFDRPEKVNVLHPQDLTNFATSSPTPLLACRRYLFIRAGPATFSAPSTGARQPS